MTNSKNTKRALLASILSMMLCMAMLIGSTFAWFTDSVTSGKNKIVAGNLDVELYHANGNVTDEKVTDTTPLFVSKDGSAIEWEPGVMVYENFTVKNVGSLALKYKLTLNAECNTVDGKSLADVLKVAILDGAFSGDRAAAQALDYKTVAEFEKNGAIAAGAADDTYAIVIYWEPSANDNDYNLNNGKESSNGEALFVDLGVTLVAAQTSYENDSFGKDYDENAPIDFVPVQNADELADAVAKGKNIVLNDNVEITKLLDFSKSVTISGNGNTISRENGNCIISVQNTTDDITITLQNVDLNASGIERCVSIYNNANLNLVLDNCSASANYYALNIASANTNVNLTIKNSEVTGWCAFQTWSEGTKATFENCTLIGNNDFGYNADGWNDFATIVINTDAPNTELTFTNCRFEANQTTGNKQYLLSVRASGAKITLDNCSYYADGSEIENLGQYVSIYQAAADIQLTIDGNLIPIQ